MDDVDRFEESKNRALFLRFISRLRNSAKRVADQLGHREREAVYQRALAAEFEALGYTSECEYPVSVVYQTSDGRQITLAHERADIAVRLPSGLIIVEVKRGAQLPALVKEGLEQSRRYASHLSRAGQNVAGVCSIAFNKHKGHPQQSQLQEMWQL